MLSPLVRWKGFPALIPCETWARAECGGIRRFHLPDKKKNNNRKCWNLCLKILSFLCSEMGIRSRQWKRALWLLLKVFPMCYSSRHTYLNFFWSFTSLKSHMCYYRHHFKGWEIHSSESIRNLLKITLLV